MSSAALIDQPAPARKPRISGPVKAAIRLMVDEGRSRAQAAKECGITDDWLYKAMLRPECRSYRNHLLEVFRESAASRSIARIDNLADGAQSENVRLQSNVFLLGIEGVSPVTKTESVNLHKHLHSGLTIVLGGGDSVQHDVRLIDGQAHEVREPVHINRIGQSVPHPNAGNAMQIEAKPQANQGPAGVPGGGQKCATDD